MTMAHLDNFLVTKAIGFHGLPLKSAWEAERGDGDLAKLGVTKIDFSVYQSRQKSLNLLDRQKRCALHELIAKKADQLFDKDLVDEVSSSTTISTDALFKISGREDQLNCVPPMEYFFPGNKKDRIDRFFQLVQIGDIVFGTVTNASNKGLIIKIHCTTGSCSQYVDDLMISTALWEGHILAEPVKGRVIIAHNFDTICCVVSQVSIEKQRLVVSLTGGHRWLEPNQKPGVIGKDQLPEYYKLIQSGKLSSYQDFVESSSTFLSPFLSEHLYQDLGLSSKEFYSNMSSARNRYPQQEYAEELRQSQASKWAFRSVAEGIEHFKEGRHSEAFQCLNEALNIDPRNVEGLVARGALYANSGSFKKAVEDFETALKLNPSHANARKYMGETLVALGRSYEEENKIEEARKAYQDCLIIIPHHEEAQHSLEFLKNKSKPPLIEPGELTLPPLNFNNKRENKDLDESINSILKGKGDKSKESSSKKGKKKKSKSKKKYSSSSSSSSESSAESSDSSSESSESDSSSSSDSDATAKKKKKREEKNKKKSLSPLSKRFSALGENANQDYRYSKDSSSAGGFQGDDYETQVRNFLDMTRDEDDYEEKVRKFVEETSKYRKERKLLEEKNSKKKRKRESKKAKKDGKKKKKSEKRKKSKKDSFLDDDESKKLREALKIFERLPVLDELGSTLKSMYGKESEDRGGNEGGKWKMMFSKDNPGEPSTSKAASSNSAKKSFVPNLSDNEREEKPSVSKKPPSPVLVPIPPRPKYGKFPPVAGNMASRSAPVKSGPVVLDKFGNFRLAQTEENSARVERKSRSRSRKRSSSSRSRSRSTRHRSKSGSYGRKYSRSRSRSYRSSRSRSYSRSRSRSRSGDRRRFDRRFRGGRGGYDRPFYKPRFGGGQQRGRGRGGYWDRDHRGGRGGNRDFQFRGGRGNGRGGPRWPRGDNRSRFDRRSRSFSYSPERPRSPQDAKSPKQRASTPPRKIVDNSPAKKDIVEQSQD